MSSHVRFAFVNLVTLELSGHSGIWQDESSGWRSCTLWQGAGDPSWRKYECYVYAVWDLGMRPADEGCGNCGDVALVRSVTLKACA